MQQEDSEIGVQDVKNLLQLACADLNSVARKLNTSPRSLQRKLAEQGASFSEILSAVQYEKAKGLLSGTSVSIAEIGRELGYQDTSNFCRAFARWSGLSPRGWRIQNNDPN